jgi:hypothetical protein
LRTRAIQQHPPAKEHRQRACYGFYVNHITDAFGTLFLMGGMGLSGYMRPMVAAILVAYFMLSTRAYLAAYTLDNSALVLEVQPH